jgi:hypothetical protein
MQSMRTTGDWKRSHYTHAAVQCCKWSHFTHTICFARKLRMRYFASAVGAVSVRSWLLVLSTTFSLLRVRVTWNRRSQCPLSVHCRPCQETEEKTNHVMVQPCCDAAALETQMPKLTVFGVPHGHVYIAVTEESMTSSIMTLITILVPDSKFDQVLLPLVNWNKFLPSSITKPYCFLSMYHLWISASSGLH